jgi:radical SAM superfamily enzyme YgiQ (UPF0313 family)
MSTNSLLVTLAGMPKILSDFIPDNGLASLAACLRENGHFVRILDFNLPDCLAEIFSLKSLRGLQHIGEKVFLERRKPSPIDVIRLRTLSRILEERKDKVFDSIIDSIVDTAKREKIDFVGIKLWAGDGFRYSLKLAASLKKKCPKLKVFGGGPQVDIFREHIYRVSRDFDALCFGEGEETITLLADYTAGKISQDQIPNLILPGNGRPIATPRRYIKALDILPKPEYRPEIYENIGAKIRLFVLDESRGCPNSCAFCIHPIKSGRRRTRSPLSVVAEIEHGALEYGASLFRYAGSSTPGSLMKDVAQILKEKNFNVSYTSFGHFRDFAGMDFHLLRESGCRSLFFGVESASPEILRRAMNKTNNPDEMAQVIKNSKDAGIFTVVSIIFPAPFETEKTRAETLDFLKKTRPDSVLVQFPGLFPGTPWAQEPERFNFTLETDDYAVAVMTYQIKSLFPPNYWKPLPYRVNGMNFHQFANETARFQKDLQAAGIGTFVSDEAFLLSVFAGFKDLDEFVAKNRYWLFAGRAEELKKEIESINKASYAGGN